MNSQALHDRPYKTQDSCPSTLPRPFQLYPFLTKTHSLLSTRTPLTATPHIKKNHSPSFFSSSNLLCSSPFHPSTRLCYSLWLPLQVCFAPDFLAATSPPSLINVTPHQLHQSRRHLPVIPSQTARKLLPHASHAQLELVPPLKKIRSAALINEATGLVLISHSRIHTQCTITGQIRAVTPCSVTVRPKLITKLLYIQFVYLNG